MTDDHQQAVAIALAEIKSELQHIRSTLDAQRVDQANLAQLVHTLQPAVMRNTEGRDEHGRRLGDHGDRIRKVEDAILSLAADRQLLGGMTATVTALRAEVDEFKVTVRTLARVAKFLGATSLSGVVSLAYVVLQGMP